MAKLFVGQVTSRVADTCLQLHGGFGYWTIASRIRRAGVEVMKEIIAKTGWGLRGKPSGGGCTTWTRRSSARPCRSSS